MSKLIEEIALKYCKDHDIEIFCSGDLEILHHIYDVAEKTKNFKPLANKHPLNIIRRVRNAMRTGYYFDKSIVKVKGDKKMAFYKLKESKRCRMF